MEPSTRAQLRAEGVPVSSVDRRVRSGAWRSPMRGIYLPAAELTLPDRAKAALLTQPSPAWISHETAVLLYGWATRTPTSSAVIHLTVPAEATTSQRRGVRLHWRGIEPKPHVVDGLPITSPARTLVDMARLLPSLAATTLVDSALRTGCVAREELLAELALWDKQRGVVGARFAIGRAQPGTRSVPETELRLIALDAGLEGVCAGYTIWDGYGDPLAEADAADESLMIWLEYDGFEVHSERRQFRRDRRRAQWLKERGWDVNAFADEQLRDPGYVDALVRSMITRAPARIAALPAGLSPEADRARQRLGA